LLLDEAPRLLLDQRDRVVQADLAAQVLADLPVAEPAHGRQLPIVAGGHQALDLGDQAIGDHAIYPRVDAGVELGPGPRDADLQDAVGGWGFALQFGDGLAADQAHLQRPDHAAHVAMVDAGRGRGVQRGQPGVQRLSPFRLRFGCQLGPQLGMRRDFWNAPPFHDRMHVLAGAADQERHSPAGVEGVDHRVGHPLVLGQGQRAVGVYDVQQVMRDPCALCGCDFGGADVHAAVDLA